MNRLAIFCLLVLKPKTIQGKIRDVCVGGVIPALRLIVHVFFLSQKECYYNGLFQYPIILKQNNLYSVTLVWRVWPSHGKTANIFHSCGGIYLSGHWARVGLTVYKIGWKYKWPTCPRENCLGLVRSINLNKFKVILDC